MSIYSAFNEQTRVLKFGEIIPDGCVIMLSAKEWNKVTALIDAAKRALHTQVSDWSPHVDYSPGIKAVQKALLELEEE